MPSVANHAVSDKRLEGVVGTPLLTDLVCFSIGDENQSTAARDAGSADGKGNEAADEAKA